MKCCVCINKPTNLVPTLRGNRCGKARHCPEFKIAQNQPTCTCLRSAPTNFVLFVKQTKNAWSSAFSCPPPSGVSRLKKRAKRLDVAQEGRCFHGKELLQRSLMLTHQVRALHLPIAHGHDDQADVEGHGDRITRVSDQNAICHVLLICAPTVVVMTLRACTQEGASLRSRIGLE